MSESAARESVVQRWRRRSVSLPLYLILFAVVWGGMPVWLAIGYLVDCMRLRPRQAPFLRATLFFALYLLAEVLGVGAAAALWIVTLGGRLGGRARWIGHNAALQRVFTDVLFSGARFIFRMSLRVEGREHGAPGPFLLFVRHSSTADTVLAAALIANPHQLLLKYVLKRELLWDPCLDIVGQRLPNAFIGRGAETRDAQTTRIAALASDLDATTAVLIYPEGTRFSPAKLEAAVDRVEHKGRDAVKALARSFRVVLPPRVLGPITLLERARGVDVLFLDHVGFEGAASFGEFASGALNGAAIQARIRRVKACDIPHDALDAWLFEQWLKTDAWTFERLAERRQP